MNLKEALDNHVFEVIGEIGDTLNQKTFVIGGFVRDYLLQRELKKDIDIVTEGSGIALAKETAKVLGNTSSVSFFKRFGTAMFRHKDIDWEFVGARKESYSKDSRKPAVEDGSIQDDQLRRDFTINALAISLNQKNYGEFVDPFNGMQDLQDKVIRTPLDPNITYSDDPLRMMRAIRFASQLNFDIEADSFHAIQQNAKRLDIISIERIMAEFNKILLSPKPSYGLILLDNANLLERFLPELTDLKGIEEKEGQTHKDNFYHTFEVVDNISKHTDNLWLIWAALLHDIGKAPTKKFDNKVGWTFHSHEFVGSKMVPKIFRRLRLPMGNEMQYVKKLVMLSSRPIPLVSEEATDNALRRLLFDAGQDLEDLFTLCKADITTKNAKKQARFKNNFNKVEEKIKEVEERDHIRNFQPPISGEDIMQAFNIQPCREVGMIKNKIKEAILDGELKNDRNEAYAFMLRLGKKAGFKIQKNL
ncbi:HD domain-containing protein [Flavobacteriaceae bacterium Ap0902]|nr:HD domain-containing protein [Flavobacteriaceae bacterium Ap0902]